jgi:hypothetical protein
MTLTKRSLLIARKQKSPLSATENPGGCFAGVTSLVGTARKRDACLYVLLWTSNIYKWYRQSETKAVQFKTTYNE